MKKQNTKPRKLKVYMIVILILLIPILFFSIEAYGYNENLYWRGGSGNISDKSRWFISGTEPCFCVPKVTSDSINTVYFDSSSGSGTVYLDINISSGPVYIMSDTDITISFLNNTKWTIYIYNPGPALTNPNPAFDVGKTLFSAFYILVFVTLCVMFVMGAFWIRKVRGKIG